MKNKKDLINLSHSALTNQLKTLKETPPAYNMHGLVEENKLKWFFKMLSQLGNNHYPYQSYLKPEVNNGVFKMNMQNAPASVALLSDWASNTMESHRIARLCGVRDYSIHLGDTYYVGNEKEIAENFNSTLNAPWPYGSCGSFALPGNHEMYSGGKSYFTQLLPYMGTFKGEKTNIQEAGFFCLENDYWKIIGLDTGYYSLGGWFGTKPNFNMQLHEKQIDWLRNEVKLGKDNKGIILLSHHQPLSAFETAYPLPAQQLAEFIKPKKKVLWFWGHEHRLAVYGQNQLPCGNIYGRCIGNGGMPVELNSKQRHSAPVLAKDTNLVLYDDRIREKFEDKIYLGHNGFTILNFYENNLTIEYFDDHHNSQDEKARKILEEKWVADIETGNITGTEITDETELSKVHLRRFTPEIKTAIN